MNSSYTEAHRASYEKHKPKNLTRMKTYYQQNKEIIKEKRRARYAVQKLIRSQPDRTLRTPESI